jgi:hypothetical protein
MKQYRTCKAGEKCHWPGGPRQPLHRFTATYYDVIHEYEYCVSCRAHKSRQVMESRARHTQADKIPARVKPKVDDVLPSNADISPEYQQALTQWVSSLIIRRGDYANIREARENQ